MDRLPADATERNSPLDIAFTDHERVVELIDRVRYSLEAISVSFDRWEEDHVKGPGFYVAIVSAPSVEGFADPMGNNRWPVDTCRNVFEDQDAFHRAAETVAHGCDGAVVASVDGVILEQMVRLRDLGPGVDASRTEYAEWMGSRHMSAVDTSARPDVVATVTLSEENGRVTVAEDGAFEDFQRNQLGGRWRAEG